MFGFFDSVSKTVISDSPEPVVPDELMFDTEPEVEAVIVELPELDIPARGVFCFTELLGLIVLSPRNFIA